MKRIEKWLDNKGIEEVEAIIPDFAGTARGKYIPTQRYVEDRGFRIGEGIFSQAITGDYAEYVTEVNPTDIDMQARPAVETVRIVPWATNPTAQIIHDCFHMDGKPVAMAPRQILRHILSLYDELGLKAIVAPEIEFYLTEVNTDPNQPLEPPLGRSGRQEKSRRSFSIDAINEYEDLIETIFNWSDKQGLSIETLTHEDGVSQMEVNFEHGDPMELADQVFTFKRTAREAAFKHHTYATFMAKPYQHQPGSSMHLHQSIVNRKTGKNIFSIKDGKPNKAFRSYIAGLQRYTPAVMPFYAPNVNSYRRITRYFSAPINTHWGIDNRTVGLRVPISTPAGTRVENRIAGADTNPYLAMAASLACGYLGMMEELVPMEPLKDSAYDYEITLPRDMHAALKLLRRSRTMRKIFGKEFIQMFVEVKLVEYEEFFQVISPWEREHLLLKV